MRRVVLVVGILGLVPLRGSWAQPAPCAPPREEGALLRLLGGKKGTVPHEWFFLGGPKGGPLGDQARRVAAAVEREIGRDARCIKVVVLDEKELLRRFGGSPFAPAGALGGFHRPGLATSETVFVRREGVGMSDVVLAHEVIHALSISFGHQAERKHYRNLVEGLTQFFARRVVDRHLGISGGAWMDAYRENVAVIDRLAQLIGEGALKESFFSQGLPFLERRVDERLGPGAFRGAVLALEAHDTARALAILGGHESRLESPPAANARASCT